MKRFLRLLTPRVSPSRSLFKCLEVAAISPSSTATFLLSMRGCCGAGGSQATLRGDLAPLGQLSALETGVVVAGQVRETPPRGNTELVERLY